MRRKIVTFSIVLAATAGTTLAQQVVNIDFNGSAAGGDTTHVGDDGALSTAGGTVWNGVQVGTSAQDLLDEFGVKTPVDVLMSPNAFGGTDPASTNNLQDSGISSPFFIADLLPSELYTVVGYVGPNGGFNVTDASGSVGFQGFGDPTYLLPGVQGGGPTNDPGDYVRFDGLQPYDLGGGVYGLAFSLDGLVTGVQIQGVIPTPATIVMAGFAGIPVLRRRRL